MDNLDVKWSIDSLPCKVTVIITAVFFYFINALFLLYFLMCFKRNHLMVPNKTFFLIEET